MGEFGAQERGVDIIKRVENFMINSKVLSINLTHVIFYFWFLLDFLVKTNICDAINLNRYSVNTFQNIVTIILIVGYCIVGTRYELKDLAVIVAVGLLCLITGINSSSYVLLSAFLFMIIVKDSDIEEIIVIVAKILTCLIPVIIIMSLVGLIDGGNTYRFSNIRYGLGFTHPNTLGWAILELLCCNFYIHRNSIRRIDYFLTFIAIPFLYLVPNSLSAVVGTIMLLLLMFIYDIINNRYFGLGRNMLSNILIFLGIGVNIYSIFFTINDVAKYKIPHLIDTFASSRLFYSNKSYSMYGFKTLGQEIILKFSWERGYMETYLDNSFSTLLLRYGVVMYILYTIGSVFVFGYLKKTSFAMLICFFIFYFMGVMNSSVLSVGQNVFMLCFGAVLFPRKSINLQNELVTYEET